VQEWLEDATGLATLLNEDPEDVRLGQAYQVVPEAGPHAGEAVEAVVVQNGDGEARPKYVDDGEHSYLVGGEYLAQDEQEVPA